MKFPSAATASGAPVALSSAGPSPEGRTRDAVARLILQSGPLTAAVLAERLALSPAAIRRHLETLVGEGVLAEVEPRLGRRPRGRGRPARAYALTDVGRARFAHAYDDLASTALRYLRETGGEDAVRAFAEHRAQTLADRIRPRVRMDVASGGSARAADRVADVAAALTDEGYAANSEPAVRGLQICQHHCPVAHVAAEFPELCEAETRALADVLGTYVQRLATIAHGDGVCTTHVPTSSTSHPTDTAHDRSPAQLSQLGRK